MQADSEQPILKFDNVSVHFDEARALDGVSFEIHRGETRIILGEAGSGKTTLLKAATGLQRVTSGRVYAFGQDITTLRENELFPLRAKVGVLFQEGGLFDSLTVEENVAYPLLNQQTRAAKKTAASAREKVEEALRFVELEHTLDKFPSELSGGMRRRVGIARATVTEPPLVLYDSPTAGLDPITANTIIALVCKEREFKNTTTVMVTHRFQDGHIAANYRYNPDSGGLELASKNGHRVDLRTKFMVMREGKLVFEGSERELMASEDSYVRHFVRH